MTASDPAAPSHGRGDLARERPGWLFPARLAIGVIQGLLLLWIYKSGDTPQFWPTTTPTAYGPLFMVAAYLPVVILGGLGRMRPRTLIAWAVGAGVVLALLGAYDVARQTSDTLRMTPFVSPPFLAFIAAALFIGHHLILPADRARKPLAPYPDYFDTAWLAGVQLAMSAAFTGAVWLALILGMLLFKLIGLDFLGDLVEEAWFSIPLTAVLFSLAVHLTDVRDGLIRGIRTVALMLLSWVLPVLTVLIAGFLLALPFTGLGRLWETASAAATVLIAAGGLIILINTAYQDGQPDNRPPASLRLAARLASLLLLPLIIIAVWALALRIGQYGLTPARIIASACAFVGAGYGLGYAFAALQPFWRKTAGWMQPLERTNVIVGVVVVATILALFSPLLDPARLSVGDQVARLQRGDASPQTFDYQFLRFSSGKSGRAALATLAASSNPEIATRTRAVQKQNHRSYNRDDDVLGTAPVIQPVAGSALPSTFLTRVQPDDVRSSCVTANPCVAALRDMDGDGVTEILLANHYQVSLWAFESRQWTKVGVYQIQRCDAEERPDLREVLRAGQVAPRPGRWPDLDLGGDTTRFSPEFAGCRGTAIAAAAAEAEATGAEAATATASTP